MVLGAQLVGVWTLPLDIEKETEAECEKFLSMDNGGDPIVLSSTEDASNATILLTDLVSCTKKNVSIDGMYFVTSYNSSKYRTGLMIASKFGLIDVVKNLLDHNADIDVPSGRRHTALMMASGAGHLDIVSSLLDHKADVIFHNQDYSISDGSTALMIASAAGHLDIVTLLLDHKADVNKQDGQGETALMKVYKTVDGELEKYKGDGNIQDRYEEIAAKIDRNGNIDIVKELLTHNADVNIKNLLGKTALMSAAEEGQLVMVKELLKHNADVNIQSVDLIVDLRDLMTLVDGNTALMLAAREGHVDVVKELIYYM